MNLRVLSIRKERENTSEIWSPHQPVWTKQISSPYCFPGVRLAFSPTHAEPWTTAQTGKCSLRRCFTSVGTVCAQFWFRRNYMQHIHFRTAVSFIYLFPCSAEVSNHQTACEQVPLNMLSLSHNRNALCCCNDFSLPPLIKCFAKLSGKYFPFYSQEILREEDGEKTVLRGGPASLLLLHGYSCSTEESRSHLGLTHTVKCPRW